MDTSITMLLGCDDDSIAFYNGATEDRDDSSSGYDSSDSHEDDKKLIHSHVYESSSPSRPCTNRKRFHGDKSFKFKSTRLLCEDLMLILDMPEMCDVTFLVGPQEVPVHGVRAILATRSRVFYQLILQHSQTTKDTKDDKKMRSPTNRFYIPVTKYDPEVFRSLVKYVHCGTVTITLDNVTGLLCGATQFKLGDLEDVCWDFIRQCVLSGDAQRLLSPTRGYKHFRVVQVVLNEIYSYLDKQFDAPLESTV